MCCKRKITKCDFIEDKVKMSCDVGMMNYVQQVKGILLLANVELAVAVEAADFLRNPLAPAGPCLWSRSGFSSNYRT